MRRPNRCTVPAAALGVVLAVVVGGIATGPARLVGAGAAPLDAPAGEAAEGAYTEQVVADAVGDCKAIGDFDGDGHADVALGGLSLAWYRGPTWELQPVEAAVREFTTDCQVADVDADGDADLVVPDGVPGVGTLHWFDNDGTGRFTRRLIGESGYRHDVEVADLTGDGLVDVVTRRAGDLTVWYQDPGVDGGWGSRRLSGRGGEGTAVGDVDGDGWVDVLLGGYWLRNPGEIGGAWLERTITPTEWASVAVGDVDGDGRADVVLGLIESAGDEHAWYSAGDPLTGPWVRHVIAEGTGAGFHTHELADMDGDGRLDLLTGKMTGGVWVYANRAEGWQERLVSSRKAHNLRVGDIDGDGVADVLAGGYLGNPPLYVLFGPSAPPPTSTTLPPPDGPGPGPAVVRLLPTGDAHVRNGTTRGTNFGTAPVLEVKTDGAYGYTREAYLTFPVPAEGEVDRAVLRLHAELQKGSLVLAAHEVASAPDEATVTWEQRPPFGALVSSRTVTGTGAQVVDLDVTAAVLAARAEGRAAVTIGLRGATSGEPLLRVNAREAASGRPLLEVTPTTATSSTTTAPTTTAPPAPTTTAPPAPTTTAPPATTTTAPTTTTTAPRATTTTAPTGPAPTVLRVVATADAHVRDGDSAATNYGGSPTLEVKAGGAPGANRESYLTFPLPGAMDPRRAAIRLTVDASGAVPLTAHRVGGTLGALEEATLTWDRRPALGDVVARTTATGGGRAVVELDVTDAVLAARAAGEQSLTVGLRSASGGAPLLEVRSREAPADRPVLVLRHP